MCERATGVFASSRNAPRGDRRLVPPLARHSASNTSYCYTYSSPCLTTFLFVWLSLSLCPRGVSLFLKKTRQEVSRQFYMGISTRSAKRYFFQRRGSDEDLKRLRGKEDLAWKRISFERKVNRFQPFCFFNLCVTGRILE